jgi:hypothetical protein
MRSGGPRGCVYAHEDSSIEMKPSAGTHIRGRAAAGPREVETYTRPLFSELALTYTQPTPTPINPTLA